MFEVDDQNDGKDPKKKVSEKKVEIKTPEEEFNSSISIKSKA